MSLRVDVKLRGTNDEGVSRVDPILCGDGRASIQFFELIRAGGQFHFGHFIFYLYLHRLERLRACIGHLNFNSPSGAFYEAYIFHIEGWNRRRCYGRGGCGWWDENLQRQRRFADGCEFSPDPAEFHTRVRVADVKIFACRVAPVDFRRFADFQRTFHSIRFARAVAAIGRSGNSYFGSNERGSGSPKN